MSLEVYGKSCLLTSYLSAGELMIYNRVYNSRTALEPAYPATLPSTGDSPAFDSLLKITDRYVRRDSPVDQESRDLKSDIDSNDLTILHAPPGYVPSCLSDDCD
jgi:hypothetical protein